MKQNIEKGAYNRQEWSLGNFGKRIPDKFGDFSKGKRGKEGRGCVWGVCVWGVHAKLLQLCPTPMGSHPMDWKWKSLSHVRLFVTPWAMQSTELSRPEYWNGQPFPSPGDLPNPGIKPRSPALQADSLPAEPPWKSKNTGVGSLSLLQRIFQTQELNRGLLRCRWIPYPTDYRPSVSSVHGILQERILGWNSMPSSRLSSQPRDQTHVSYVSCIGWWVLQHYTIWEARAGYAGGQFF